MAMKKKHPNTRRRSKSKNPREGRDGDKATVSILGKAGCVESSTRPERRRNLKHTNSVR